MEELREIATSACATFAMLRLQEGVPLQSFATQASWAGVRGRAMGYKAFHKQRIRTLCAADGLGAEVERHPEARLHLQRAVTRLSAPITPLPGRRRFDGAFQALTG